MSLTQNSTLLSVKVTGEICDSIGKFNVEQYYKSTNTNPLEITYTFTLDNKAVITDVYLKIGDRQLVGVLENKLVNSENYKEAIENKYIAMLLEKNYDSYTLKLGNIEPNIDISIRYSYITQLNIVDNKYVYVLPTNIAPKYIQTHNKTTQEIIDNIKKSNDIEYTSDDTGYSFNINVVIKSMNKINLVDSNNRCEYHKITDNEYLVSSYTKPSSGDLVIKFDTKINPCAYRYENYCYLNFNFEPENIKNNKSKTYNIIVDRSGSMANSKINNAKDALKLFITSLPSNSYFNIISFGSTYNALWKNSVKYSDDTIQIALKHCNTMNADMGGTELYNCLECCINEDFDKFTMKEWSSSSDVNDDKELRENIIIVITDGQISSMNNIYDKYKDKNFRVFALGIGNDCNRHQLEQLSHFGIARIDNDSKVLSNSVIDILDLSNKKYYTELSYNDKIIIKYAYPNTFISTFIKLNDNISDEDKLRLKYKTSNSDDNLSDEYCVNMTNIYNGNENEKGDEKSGDYIKQMYYNKYITDKKCNLDEVCEISKSHSILTNHTSFFLKDINTINIEGELDTEVIKHHTKHHIKHHDTYFVDDIRICTETGAIGERVLENLSSQRAVITGNRFERKSARITKKWLDSGSTKKWISREDDEPNMFVKAYNSVSKYFSYLFSKNQPDQKERNRIRKQKTDEMRRRFGLLEDSDDENNNNNQDTIDILDFKQADGSFRLCDKLIELCGFDTNTAFNEIAEKINVAPNVLINIAVLIKLQKLDNDKYKLIITYLNNWIDNNKFDINDMTYIFETMKQYVK